MPRARGFKPDSSESEAYNLKDTPPPAHNPPDLEALSKALVTRKANAKALPKEELITALHAHDGQLFNTAVFLGVDPLQLQYRVQSDYELKNIILDHREVLLDKAEAKLAEKVEKGDMRAITFTLKTLGRHRGYVERNAELPSPDSIHISKEHDTLDLTKLSTEQLQTLGHLVNEATGKMVDITPKAKDKS